MKLSRILSLCLITCVALAWLQAAPAQADVMVTVYNGNPGGAGNGTGVLDYSSLTQLGTFSYYQPQFGVYSQAGGNNPAGDWRPFYKDDNYSTRITGQINVAAVGSYTFSTRSDDGSILKIDGNVVVNNNFYQGPTTRTGTVTLTPGVHNVEIQFYQGGGGKSLDVGSGVSVNQLPAGVTWVEHKPLVTVNVYAGQDRYNASTGVLQNPNTPLLGTFSAPDINFDYATGSRWSPFGRTDDYSVSITGFLNAQNSQNYTFGLNSDDGSFLYIDGVLVVNDGFYQGSNQSGLFGAPQVTGVDFLTAGLHTFEVRMYQGGGGAGVTLFLPNGVAYANAPAAVPEPSSLALLGSASAVGLIGYLRRRRKLAA